MKRLVVGVSILGAVALLAGCPIYPSTNANYRVCDAYTCYDCPDPFVSSSCVSWQCGSSSDCDNGFACDGGRCTSAPSTPGSGAGASDCAFTGCPAGSICRLAGGAATCVPFGGSGNDAHAPSPLDASSDEGVAHDAASETASRADAFGATDAFDGARAIDAADGEASLAAEGPDASDGSSLDTPCNADGDCAQTARCIDGRCTSLSSLCSDGTQCVAPGSACVDGICEPRCDPTLPCPTGFQCDLPRGACNIDPTPCSGAGASTCLGGTTCVERHCVPPCSTRDTGAACPVSQRCVNGGCLPDQAATFSCKNDGQTGALSNGCGPASVCLHHSCYPACVADGGSADCGDASAVCKDVTVAPGTYSVCGGPSNLGSACDVAAGKPCPPPGVCIDGYCR